MASNNNRRPGRSGFEQAQTDELPAIKPLGYEDNPGVEKMTSEDTIVTSQRISRVPRLFRFDNRPPEATALALDITARATVLMASIFLGPALLELATQSVEDNCSHHATEAEQESCIQDGRVYGFRPSSVLSNIAVAAGLVGAVFMPVFGALVDHTDYRWRVGAYSAFGLVVVKGLEVMVSSQTWFVVACLQVVSVVLFHMHITTTLAYTSELSTDQTEQTAYNTYYVVVLYLATLVFLAFVTALSFGFDQGDVGTARISQVTTSSVSGIIFYIAWKYFFRDRPALNVIPDGQTVWTVGFYKVSNTFGRIARDLPSLKWLIFAVMFGEAATNALITIGTTYMKTFLEMGADDIGIVMLAVLASGAPGSKLGGWISYRVGPVYSAAICQCFFIVTTTVAASTLTGPEHIKYMPLIGALWGVGLGWLLPMHQTAFMTIIPRGQEGELMGMYIFSGQILSWLPPMLFTTINEVGMDMAYGLASLDVFFAGAVLCLFMVKSTEGKELVNMSDHGSPSEEFTEMKEMSSDCPGSPRRRSHSTLEIT